MVSAFRGAIDFFDQLGVYDVILPFLLVFTIVFAILEKTKVLGTEGKGEEPRKNLNSMVAFVMALLVVASSRIVSIINQGLAQVTLIMVMLIGFLLLIGTVYYDPKKHVTELVPFKLFGTIVLGLSVFAVFLHQIGWLEPAWRYITGYWDSTFISSLILLAVLIGFIYFVTKGKDEGEKTK